MRWVQRSKNGIKRTTLHYRSSFKLKSSRRLSKRKFLFALFLLSSCRTQNFTYYVSAYCCDSVRFSGTSGPRKVKKSRWGTTSWIIIVFSRLFLLGHSSWYERFMCKFWKNLGRRMSCNFDFKFALQRQLFEKRSVFLRCFCNRTCHVFLSMFE